VKTSHHWSGPTPGYSADESNLRDHFATIALAQIIASKPSETAEKKALEAYQIADSMMRQRERTVSGLP
jgi:hypothetical protein